MRTTFRLCLLCLLAGCSPAARPEPAWIGQLTPLSGPDRDRGEESIRAVESVLKEARDDGFTVAGRHAGVRHVDSAADARAEASRLLAVNRVCALLVGPGVANVEEVLAAARSHAAPVVVLDESADPPDQPGVYLLGPDPRLRGEALAKYARDKLKWSKVAAVVDGGRPVCAALAEAFARAWRPGGAVRRWELAALRTAADREEVKAWKPDALLLAVPASRLADAAAPLGDLPAGYPVLYGGEDGPLPALGKATYGATAYSAKAELPEAGRKWLAALEKEQGAPPGRGAVLAADGVRFLLAGLRKARLSQRARLREALDGVKEFDAVTGPLSWREGRPVRTLYIVRPPDVLVEAVAPKGRTTWFARVRLRRRGNGAGLWRHPGAAGRSRRAARRR